MSAGVGEIEIGRDTEGKILRTVSVQTDITERKKAERSLRRANRSLMVLSICNEALVRAENETDLLNKICNTLIKIGGYRFVWVGLAENERYGDHNHQ